MIYRVIVYRASIDNARWGSNLTVRWNDREIRGKNCTGGVIRQERIPNSNPTRL